MLGAKTTEEIAAESRKLRRWAWAGLIPGARVKKGKHPHFPKSRQLSRWIDESDLRISKRAAEKNKSRFPALRPATAKRTKKQVANPIPPIQKFFNDFTKFRLRLEKITVNLKMKDWDSVTLGRFVSNAEWFESSLKDARAQLTLRHQS